ncbi:uncharacterized protein LOC113492727 isoform X2 [Trichoplusia ni]|uniref:Uncharacterized protein LOC113492727 isoform X2 n=1 Tax=Trichoplusia ni TaxID=7111 RepID=A0A7E5VD31_TRINI|nr:uncharacterized protein LOC113492727 isoform X2 [Trichoplusia ni]
MTTSGKSGRHENSVETILTFDNRDLQSQWSVVWSTSHIPGVQEQTARQERMRVRGRRRLRIGSLALSALLTMHGRVPASALTGGVFGFALFLVVAVMSLANPLRHFEVYLGQWSVSGPGRAFRILPMLDGIGIAMCINAIVRAINCCAIAAIAALYVSHSVADAKLPFTYCRDFELKAYEPVMRDVKLLSLSRIPLDKAIIYPGEESSTVGLKHRAWRNVSLSKRRKPIRQVQICRETYSGHYPSIYSTPAYNYFYVEVVHLRSNFSLVHFNIPLVCAIAVIWLILWFIMILEKLVYGRLIWNNMAPWFVIIPWVWTLLVAFTAASNLTMYKTLRTILRLGAKDVIAGLADAFEVALYIHSVTVGTEIIHGKGLNYYASGHIDPALNNENVWHSVTVLLLTGFHTGGAALCALVDYIHPHNSGLYAMEESTLWVIPMYSKCTSMTGYSHLVFAEQVLVGGLMLTCMVITMIFATHGGIALLESVDSMMTGVAMPLVAVLELVSLLYVYRSHDFQSDARLATEDNACAARISIQWHIIPLVSLITLILKITTLVAAELPQRSMYLALAPLLALVVSVPLRAAHNAYTFLRPTPQTT